MSKIGQLPILLPAGVKAKITSSVGGQAGQIEISGPKGSLVQEISPLLKVKLKEDKLVIERKNEEKQAKSMHGLIRTLINNMVIGVTQGFEKVLEIQGTGYRVSKEGEKLVLTLGFSHPSIVDPVKGISFEIPDNKTIKIIGINKQLVGQVAARIRSFKKPDPYKGKGVRYQGEQIRLKAGKAGKADEAAG